MSSTIFIEIRAIVAEKLRGIPHFAPVDFDALTAHLYNVFDFICILKLLISIITACQHSLLRKALY